MIKSKQSVRTNGFTIVELLVVIVVIGILAAITIVSYSGVQNKAIIASLQSDLSSDAKKLKLYNVEHGYYPTALDGNNCPSAPEADTRYCLKYGLDSTFSYTGGDQGFKIKMTKKGITYLIREGTAPYPASAPSIGNNVATNVMAGRVIFTSTITSDGDDDIIDAGSCWGTTANPTTNCASNMVNSLVGRMSYMGAVTSGSNANGITSSPDGKSVYVISSGDKRVYMYSQNLLTTMLTPLSTASITTTSTPYGITPSHDGKNVYVANLGASSVVQIYNRNITTGILTSAGTIAANSSPSSVIVSPDDKYVYATGYGDGSVSMYRRNTTSGLLTSLGFVATGGGTPYSGMAISPDGKSLYISNQGSNNISVLSINTTTGLLTFNANVAAGDSPKHIVISPDGKYVYAANNGNNLISEYSRNTTTGAITSIGTIPANSAIIGLVISRDGKFVYSAGGATVSLFSRNEETGLLSAMSSGVVSIGTSLYGITLSNDGESMIFVNSNGSVYSFKCYPGYVSVGEPFYRVVGGQTSGQTIHYRTYATNSVGKTYSADATFVVP